MKTNVVMIRDNRKFIQRTVDGYFNATNLLILYNDEKNEKKQLGKYNVMKQTKNFIEQLIKEGIDNPIITARGRGLNSGTWMHPKLFIDFAMWISVEFKSVVIDYVLDGLIKSRHDAGDFYNEMVAEILKTYVEIYNRKPPAHIYIEEARMLKSLVMKDDRNRNEMNEQELKQLTYLQKVNVNLIRKKIGKKSRAKRLIEASEIKI